MESLMSFLRKLNVRTLTCFEVKPRMTRWQRAHDFVPDHRAYRICINKADNDRLLDESKWPADITISRWYSKNKPAETDNRNDNRSESDGDLIDDVHAATSYKNERSTTAATPETPASAAAVDVSHGARDGANDEQMEGNTTVLEIDLDDTTLMNDMQTTPANNTDGGQY